MQGDSLSQVLGLQGFYVEKATVGQERIDLELGRDDGGCYVCGQCGQCHWTYHDRYRIHPQDLPMRGINVYLHVWRYRVYCSCCDRVVAEHLPHIRDGAHMTIRLEEALHAECAETPVDAVARRYGLAWATVRDVDLRLLRERIGGQSLSGLRRIGIDEIACEKGHKYLTIVTDLDRRRVARILEERKAQSLSVFFKELGKAGCAAIECVVINMWKPYRKALRRHLPRAAIIIDKFHVIKAAHEALDQARKDEQSRLPEEQRRGLKGARWLLLRSLEKTHQRGKSETLSDLLALNETLAKAYV